MAAPFSLITSAWLPIRREKKSLEWISPALLTSVTEHGLVVAFAWPRPDFDLAAHEFMIGLLAAACPPRDVKDWRRRFLEPPSAEEFRAAFSPYESAFFLDGDGPRFSQDFDELKSEASPVEALLIDAPGANTIKLNKDLLVKRGGVRVLSRAGAAMALYTLQQFAPSGGAGHRTSLRGGGPLVTLAVPGAGKDAPAPTLWQKIWLNVPKGAPAQASDRERIFPWLAPTKTSAKKESVAAGEAHFLQTFFGMPRRIRLVFEKNGAKAPCDLTGTVDDVVVTGFITKPWGVNYGVWRHPLTPYYTIKTDTLPVHAPEGRLAYRQWLGLVYADDDGGRLPAAIMKDARDRLIALAADSPHFGERPRMIAGGFAMDNMKALAFAEAEMPLHLVGPDLEDMIADLARRLVNSAKIIELLLATAIRIALYGELVKAESDSTAFGAPRERLWSETEDSFHRLLERAVGVLASDDDDPNQTLGKDWRETLEKTAMRIFDDVAPIDAFGEIDPNRVVAARRLLTLGLAGYGKYGRRFSTSSISSLRRRRESAENPPGGKGRRRRHDQERTLNGAALAWWSALQPSHKRDYKGHPGVLARLRRAGLQEAALQPATALLYRRVKPFLRGPELPDFDRGAHRGGACPCART